jgi:excisionase family DNA binding protein
VSAGADLNGDQGHDLPWLAKRLGLSIFTCRALIRQREIGHVRAGRRIVVYEKDAAEFLSRHRVEAREAGR